MNRYHLEVQYVPESVTLLNMVALPAPYITNYMNQLAVRYGLTPDARAHRIVDLLQEIEDAARAEFAEDMETVRFYCACEEDLNKPDSFADLIMLIDVVSPGSYSVKDYQESLNDLTEQEFLTRFYEGLKAYGNSVTDQVSNDTETVADIMDILLQKDMSDARKLHLQQLFFHRKEHQEKLIGLMIRAEKLLKKYEKKLLAIGQELVDYVEGELQGQSLSDYILGEFYGNMAIPAAGKDCDVYLYYLKCAIMGFYMRGQKIEEVRPLAAVGVIFSREMSFRALLEQRAQLSEEKVMTMLKLLADKSKFQILSATGAEPAYGSQLASMLGLTTATISHHTSALLEQDLLTLDKVDTKIYYRANPVMIRALIQYLQDTLLHE
ncbi:MAG: winged helix-turn-helix transcriptional regulator [Lachnospiraceae bacterium]|nr:winged helix-turn-helix transcriptional regulator [Lachnospiraceae bacterium]